MFVQFLRFLLVMVLVFVVVVMLFLLHPLHGNLFLGIRRLQHGHSNGIGILRHIQHFRHPGV